MGEQNAENYLCQFSRPSTTTSSALRAWITSYEQLERLIKDTEIFQIFGNTLHSLYKKVVKLSSKKRIQSLRVVIETVSDCQEEGSSHPADYGLFALENSDNFMIFTSSKGRQLIVDGQIVSSDDPERHRSSVRDLIFAGPQTGYLQLKHNILCCKDLNSQPSRGFKWGNILNLFLARKQGLVFGPRSSAKNCSP